MFRIRTLALLVAGAAIAVAACGGEETSVKETSVKETSPTTTTVPITMTTGLVVFPAAVETDAGIVTIATQPTRIVSLSPTHTEMLYAIGAGQQVIGTDLFSNYPAEANDTANVDSFNFHIEEIAALEPDLVILAFEFQGEGEQLTALGIPFLLLEPPADLGGLFSQLTSVGLATGHGDTADALAGRLAERIEQIEARAAPLAGLTFFHEVDETLYSTTSASFLGDVYTRLGLVNIADELGVENPFPQLSPEYIIASDPSFVFLADAGFGVTPQSVAARPGWDVMTAVTESRVIALDTDIAGRWGPRTVDLMEQVLTAVLETMQ